MKQPRQNVEFSRELSSSPSVKMTSHTLNTQNSFDLERKSFCIFAGFALPIAIVAKCEEIINLAQKI